MRATVDYVTATILHSRCYPTLKRKKAHGEQLAASPSPAVPLFAGPFHPEGCQSNYVDPVTGKLYPCTCEPPAVPLPERQDRQTATRDEKRSDSAAVPLPSVEGVYMDRSIADFQRACQVHIGEEQARVSPDTALIGLLCDAVRCSRELAEQAKVRDAAPARPLPDEGRQALLKLADDWNVKAKEMFQAARDHDDRVVRLIASTERDLCASELRAAVAALSAASSRAPLAERLDELLLKDAIACLRGLGYKENLLVADRLSAALDALK